MSPAEKRLLMEVARQVRDDRQIEIDRLKDQAFKEAIKRAEREGQWRGE